METWRKEALEKMENTRTAADSLEEKAIDFIERYGLKSTKDMAAVYENEKANKELDLDGLALAVKRYLRKNKTR